MTRRPQTANFWRHIPMIARSAAAILLVVGLAVVLYSEHAYREARIGELTVQARVLASTVSAAVAFSDRQAAREYVNALEADPTLLAAAVYAPDGELFAGYTRPGALPLPVSLRPGDSPTEEGRLVVTAPVAQQGE